MDSLYRWYRETNAAEGFNLPNKLILVMSGAMLFHYHKNQPSFVMNWLMQLNDDPTTLNEKTHNDLTANPLKGDVDGAKRDNKL